MKKTEEIKENQRRKKEKVKNKFKNSKAITLIALVVTIVVLLILAGISINMLIGENGLITQAQEAKKGTEKAGVKERIEVEVVGSFDEAGKIIASEVIKNITKNIPEAEIEGTEFPLYVTLNGYRFEINGEGQVKEAVAKPVVSNIKITKDGTTEPTEGELTPGTNTVQITFETTVEGGTIGDIYPTGKPEQSLPYTTDGNEMEVEFTIEYTIEGKTDTHKVSIDVSKYYKINHSEVKVKTVDKSTTEYAGMEKIKEVRKGIDGNIPIPEGFNYVKGNDWGGVVITDGATNEEGIGEEGTGNEFVWVPVKDAILDLSGNTTALATDEGIKAEVNKEIAKGKYPMAIKKADGYYIGVLYTVTAVNTATKTPTIKVLSSWTPTGTSGYREPDVVTTYDNSTTYLGTINTILGLTGDKAYTTSAHLKSAMQEEYKKMIEQVEKYGGFYIGRYEMSLDDTTEKNAQSKANKTSVTAAEPTETDYYRWYGLYAKAHTYNKTSENIKSIMPYGSQYDQMMIWMAKNGIDVTKIASSEVTDITGSTTRKNVDKTNRITGSEPLDRLCNVFDLFGNSVEWTAEAHSTNVRAYRGGYCSISHSPSSRNNLFADSNNRNNSSRFALYIQ